MAAPWVRVFPPEEGHIGLFREVPRLINMPPATSRPFSYFRLLFPDTLMKEITRHTNRYAQNHLHENQATLGRVARARAWKPLTIPDFKAFLAIFYNMGIVRKPSIAQYWNSKLPSQSSYWFPRTMARNRFQNILKFIHITDHQRMVTREHPAYDPASRFRPLLNFVNRQFLLYKIPKRELCVDESLVGTKGHSVMRQYIPSKSAKYGVKLWMLCESSTGYILQMSVYRGRVFDPTPQGQLQGTNVVVSLMEEASLLNQGYHVFCDSFFSSIVLGHRLLQHNTYLTGTLRRNRPMPHTIRDADPQPGSAIYMRRGEFLCVASRGVDDSKSVRVLSTLLPAQDVPGGRPKVITAYNRNMGAVDMDDGLISAYGGQRRNQKVWKKVFLHIFHRIMMNSYIIYKENTSDRPVLSRLQYIQEVVEALSGADATGYQDPARNRRHQRRQPILQRLPRGKEKDCCVCSRRSVGIRRRSRTICSVCGRGVHRECIGQHDRCIEQ